MKREIAYTLDRMYRVIERNFWYSVEHRSALSWRSMIKTRDIRFACSMMERAYVGTKRSA